MFYFDNSILCASRSASPRTFTRNKTTLLNSETWTEALKKHCGLQRTRGLQKTIWHKRLRMQHHETSLERMIKRSNDILVEFAESPPVLISSKQRALTHGFARLSLSLVRGR